MQDSNPRRRVRSPSGYPDYPNRPINVALVTPFEINGGLAPSMQHSNSPCLMNGCSLCCRDTKMPLTNAEAIKIAQVTGKNIEDFTKPLSETEGVLQLANNPSTRACVFLETNSADIKAPGTCTIHENRPEGCRIYPVILDEDDNAWMDYLCPYPDDFPQPDIEMQNSLLELEKTISAECEMRT